MAKRMRGDRAEEYRKRNEKRDRDTRNRKGRTQHQRHQKTFRALNIQRPWARLLLTGAKSVEVRKYPLNSYKDEDLWILETKGKERNLPRDFSSKIIGTIRFEQDFEYESLAEFRADEGRHCISDGSAYDWRPEEIPKMYGWVVASVCLFSRPLMPPKVKGMIGAKALARRTTFPSVPK